jgi:RHS repeat-associated protein
VAGGAKTGCNADNEQTKFNGATVGYDANGNFSTAGGLTYTFDGRNRLTAIGGSGTASLVYDPFGRHMSKTVNSTITQFIYDRLNPVQLLNGSNTPGVTANLLTGLRIDEYFQTSASGGLSFMSDALGSTMGFVNSSGSIVGSDTYQPFGKSTANGTATTAFQFTGRENDGTGLDYYRARYYSPLYQRFIAQDPIDFRGGPNLYSYALDIPTILRDLLGLDPFWLPAGPAGPSCSPDHPGTPGPEIGPAPAPSPTATPTPQPCGGLTIPAEGVGLFGFRGALGGAALGAGLGGEAGSEIGGGIGLGVGVLGGALVGFYCGEE